ncbi:MAG: hypothetical protein J5879_05365 [Clostridia bacterium]|nr:hypothetical protein [Clostridia bacterium]
MRRLPASAAALICAALLVSCSGGAAESTAADTKTDTVETVTEEQTEDNWNGPEDMGKKYYFSADGSDENSGECESEPWKNLSRLNGTILSAGDKVLLRRGDVWNERLEIRGKGSEEARIYVGPYGDGDGMPCISLSNSRDDIAVLCEDTTEGLCYIWIDGIDVRNSTLGVYFRFAKSTENRGIRVSNCRFTNINCPDLMNEALTDLSWLGAERAGLDGGGAYEYIWPAAINVGGRPPLPLSATEIPGVCAPSCVVSGIEICDCEFISCVVGVGANCYNYHYGMGENQFRGYTKNWKISRLRATGTMTVFNFDSCSFGYDGTEQSEYGIFEDIICTGGMEGFTMSAGTTLALFSSCCDLYIKNSRFSGCRNNGAPDGCGFDFERDDHNITLDSCVIDNNDGQGVLVMDTVLYDQVTKTESHTPNTDCAVINCLFYNNMRNVYNGNYKFDVLVFNRENENFTVSGNTFYYRRNTSGAASVRINRSNSNDLPAGAVKKGVICENNTLVCRENESDLPDIDALIEETFGRPYK